MRPLAGVVTGCKGQTLTIELESGLTVNVARQAGIGYGSRCWVGYDFTKRKVTSVHKYAPDAEVEEDTTQDIETDGEHGDDDATDEAPNEEDSGALRPCSDEWEFWRSDSGVLGLS